MAEKIRAAIVDDERLARQRIRRLLQMEPDIEIAGECATAAEAVELIRNSSPDLVFLDVQMPDRNGFTVVEALAPAPAPYIIFVTAHDQYALRAFEVNALDYLLKPFDRPRFREALDRARKQIRAGGLDARMAALLNTFGRKTPERMVVKSAGRVLFLRPEELDWIEAEDNYVRLHAGAESYLLRETLNSIEKRLDPSQFARIHRSTLVNLDRVRQLEPMFHGNYVAVLKDGTRLNLSRTYRDRLGRFLGGEL